MMGLFNFKMLMMMLTATLGLALAAPAMATGSGGGGVSANAGANAGAKAASNIDNEGSVGVGAVGGANPCAVGGGIGIPGVGGFSITHSDDNCETSREASDIAKYCMPHVTPACLHLANNNSKIRESLIAAGILKVKQPAPMMVKEDTYVGGKAGPSKMATESPAMMPASTSEPVEFSFNGRKYRITNPAHIQKWNNCEPMTMKDIGRVRAPGCGN